MVADKEADENIGLPAFAAKSGGVPDELVPGAWVAPKGLEVEGPFPGPDDGVAALPPNKELPPDSPGLPPAPKRPAPLVGWPNIVDGVALPAAVVAVPLFPNIGDF